MTNLIIYTHPNPSSFSGAIKDKVQEVLTSKGQSVTVVDLYAENFNPILSDVDFATFKEGNIPSDIKKHQDLIMGNDRLILIYPVWWNQMPAILKGYIDRVFAYGFAYAVGTDGIYQKLLTGKKGVIFNSFGTPGEYVEGPYADAMNFTQNQNIFGFCGIESEFYEMFTGVPSASDETRKEYLNSIYSLF